MARLVPHPIDNFYHLSYPKLTVAVTCGTYEKPNAIAVSWHTVLSFNPPLYGVAISPRRYSHRLIEENGEFGVNFLPFERSDIVWKVGSVSGKRVDKFEKFGLKKFRGRVIKAPLLEESIAALECVVVDSFRTGDHTFFVGEVKYAWAREGLFDEGTLDVGRASQAYYVGEGAFVALDPSKVVRFL